MLSELHWAALPLGRRNYESQVSGTVRNCSKIRSVAGSPRSADSMDQPFFGVSLMADSHRTPEQEKSELDRNTSFQEWLVDGGEMGTLILSMDWSATPLGLMRAPTVTDVLGPGTFSSFVAARRTMSYSCRRAASGSIRDARLAGA